jgi:hypothetical protein
MVCYSYDGSHHGYGFFTGICDHISYCDPSFLNQRWDWSSVRLFLYAHQIQVISRASKIANFTRHRQVAQHECATAEAHRCDLQTCIFSEDGSLSWFLARPAAVACSTSNDHAGSRSFAMRFGIFGSGTIFLFNFVVDRLSVDSGF